MKRTPTVLLSGLLALGSPLFGQALQVDFNSNQDGGGDSAGADPQDSIANHNQEGYQSYHANHEAAAEFSLASYGAFGTTVTVLPEWPDTADNRVQQSIDRGAGNDANWGGQKVDLLTDWIGIDTRIANGGNGAYDGVTGLPTRMTLTIAGLPAGAYSWRSYHHDTENMHGEFTVELSTDGGTTFTPVGDIRQGTDSTPGGAPASAMTFDGITEPASGDPADLPSTVTTSFVTSGAQDVVVRFTSLYTEQPLPADAPVHRAFFVMNGFEIDVDAAVDPDSDADGLVDLWEDRHFGDNSGTVEPSDLTPQNGTGDPDNDNATNEQEETAGSDPNVADTDGDGLNDGAELTTWFTNPNNADSDGDGIEDGEEVVAGTDTFITDPNDDDTDGDGILDGDEVAAGTDPTDETDFPREAQLAVDFNSNQDGGGDSTGADPQDSVANHNQEGYQSYHANHEAIEEFTMASYSAFGTTITLLPEWPDSFANTVQQSIDRGAGNDNNWNGEKIDLLTDWIGVDTRTGQGGNGAYDGVNGSPTRMTMTIGGLPAGSYSWLSYHHDTEHMHPEFIMEVSTDGGATFLQIGGVRQGTDSTPGGNPDSGMTFDGTTEPASGDPADLPSTVKTCFIADGASDVVFRYTPLYTEQPLPFDAPVHQAFFVMNGFEIDEFPNDSDDDCFDDDVETALFGDLSQGPNDDFDNDGLDNVTESILETDPTVADTDMDGLSDGDEVNVHGSSPLITDTDGDTLSDGDEVTIGTSPANPDTDSDGFDDGFEVAQGAPFNPLVDNSAEDFDMDGLTTGNEVDIYLTDPLVADTDMDGLDDGEEVLNFFTDPLLADSDLDGLSDGDEVNVHMTDPADPDTDFDFMDDGWEVDNGLDPNNPDDATEDPDMDGLTNEDEFVFLSDPNEADSDSDGLDDGDEINVWFTEPGNPDTDGDGLLDGQEVTETMTDPGLADTDGDGDSDYAEILAGSDPNNFDEVIDNDGDGYNNAREIAEGTDPDDPESFPIPPAGALFVDFNSNQDGGGDSSTDPDPSASLANHLQAGYQSYHANHEAAAEFVTASYPAFGTTVEFTPTWPDTTDNRVQQSIDRGAGNDNNWNGDVINLLTDWIGADTRPANGGLGNYDGATGTPTPMLFTLSGLPAGDYTWRSYHHDTEHMNARMQIEISTDGGATFGPPIETTITDSTPAGTPASDMTYDGPAAPGSLDPEDLPSTVTVGFTATGADVVIRFVAFAEIGVHRQFVVVNGFEITEGLPPAPAGDVVLTDVGFNGAAFEVTASGLDTNASYQLKRSTDGQAFMDVGAPFQPTSSTFTVQDPAPAGEEALYQIFEAAP